MPNHSRQRSPAAPDFRSNTQQYAAPFLAAIALIYALLAGLHTLQDFDLGWQLATGRWILHHRQIFSTDVFSYTAQGQPWIYPILSGIVFYVVYLVGGYALLCWMGAAACAGTVALLLRRKDVVRSALALVAVPLIASRTQPRADMFTTILFAAFLTLLWRHYRTGHAALWLLPLLMVGWVNLHLGFAAGLALCGAYLLLEIMDLPFPGNRPAVLARLQKAWPWLALTGVATFANPWGVYVYLALLRQERAQSLHTAWVVEWENIRPSWSSLQQALDWRDPQSSFWWLIAVALVSICVAVWRKRLGVAALLASSVYLAIQHVRLQGLFACVAVVVGGFVLEEAWQTGKSSFGNLKTSALPVKRTRPSTVAMLLLTAVLSGLAGVRSWALISNRYYLRSTQLSWFGTGLSWWYPERAVEFLRREKLPANVFNSYSLGGYLTWRLYPEYRDYIDGRAIPFGAELFFRAYDLSAGPPESSAWQQEADSRNINTIIVSLARYQGMTLFPQLLSFCQSKSWRPVYLDEVSAVFVRRTPQTASLVDRLQIDCDKVVFALPADRPVPSSWRTDAELFNSWANAAGVLYSLERYSEALAYLDRAQTISAGNANLHLVRALVLEHTGRAPEAEAEFRTSIRLEPGDEAWFDLGLFYMTQKRYAEAAEVFRQSAADSSRPHDMWMMLGQADLQMDQPQPALAAFDKAEATSPFREGGESLGAGFNSLLATGRAKAWYQLGDVARAVSFQEEAVRLAPNDPKLWLGLADLYEAQGRAAEAAQARDRATRR